MADVPSLFRVILQVSDLDKAAVFYDKLLGITGRRVVSSRHYYDCGPVILALVDTAADSETPKPAPDYLYLSVADVDAVHTRARELDCLSDTQVHGAPAGEVVQRPWGERSFYVDDPFGNGLCFVDEKTVFTGRR
jgi:catechol-2,3-dioxygenase